MASQIQLRRDTAANWTSSDAVLAQGEQGLETDTGKLKYGDGSTAWTSLDYFADSFEVSQISDLTATAAELNILDGATVTASELNILDGATVTTTELNYVDGVTSAIQTQLDGKVDEVNGAVTTAATGSTVVRNITLSTSAPTGGMDGDVWLVYEA
jgi:hypothetical protein